MHSAIHLHVLGPSDLSLHPAYCDYVAQVFTQADFRRWCEWGQWSDSYRAFCLVEGGRVVANASLSRMRLWIDGKDVEGFQLGAVGCLTGHRGQGLARRAMQAALAVCGRAPVLLFANPTVLDFYPRFGFAAAPQWRFESRVELRPGAEPAPALDLADPVWRAEFLRLATVAAPSAGAFAARDYGRIATWYAANGYASPLRRLDRDTLVFAQVEDGMLTIEDVFCAAPERFDPVAAVPRLIDAPVRALRFGFGPPRGWPRAEAVAIEDDAHLFVRGLDLQALPAHRFPLLART
ncbi:GNAT family N-acetyltransferase [Lysobacter firmicutimachus]|uniref:GNAT family N-acetyltransferase n=1 Tax=Lysobacter firmicutimachus TaxID=1792846 RepID=A0ABU8D414_9GAMM